MAFKNKKKLKRLLRCPDTLGKIYWLGNRGRSLRGKTPIRRDGNAFIFFSSDLPENFHTPEYESSNPYQKKSLELIKKYSDGIVVDLGAGNPKKSFPNVCQVEIRKYPNTDIVITEGKIPLKSKSVDAVISEAVLEHVKNPIKYISEIHRILKNSGEVLLDSAFMQPFHGYPHHYFNTTSSALRLLFNQFEIERLHVGPHQHPWVTLQWIFNSFWFGFLEDRDRDEFRAMTIGEAMDLLNSHQEMRATIKQSDDPWYIAEKLKEFNNEHQDSLKCFSNLSKQCEEELAAGFQIFARKKS